MDPKIRIKTALDNAVQTLEFARLGLDDATAINPSRKLAGVANVATWGRSVTYAVQKIRKWDKSYFDKWYTPYKDEMSTDPLMSYFADMRNDLIHVGGMAIAGSSVTIGAKGPVSLDEIVSSFGPPPPGVISTFIGDHLGGSGWEVQLQDGTVGKHYATIPDSVDIQSATHFEDPPTEHLGAPWRTHRSRH